MKILPHIIEPPVFWDRVIQGFYASTLIPLLLLAFGKLFFGVVASFLIGLFGWGLLLLVEKKGYDTGAMNIVVPFAFFPGVLAFLWDAIRLFHTLIEQWQAD